MEPAWSLADLLLGFSFCVNLLCLYVLWPRVPQIIGRRARRDEAAPGSGLSALGGEAPAPVPPLPSAQPGKEWPDMEAEGCPWGADSEDAFTCDSEEDEEDYLPFLIEFLAQKAEIEKCIGCLRETAQAMDKTHKDCTIANITASSAGVTSGILTILGFALTPVTAGASLILTATGLGLGAAAATTGISSHVSEKIITAKHSERSETLIKTCQESLNKCRGSLAKLLRFNEVDLDSRPRSDGKQPTGEELQAVLLRGVNVAQGIQKVVSAAKEIKVNVQALELARGNPALKMLAKEASAVGRTTRASLKGVEQVETAFKGTALALSKGMRVMGAVTAGIFILYDIYSIVQDGIHLAKGAKPEKATMIRDKASELEKALQSLNELHDQLREQTKPAFPERKPH